MKQKYKYAAIVCNPLVQLYKHPLANVGICSYFICDDYHVVQSFCLRKNILLHTCKLSLLSGVAGCGRAQRPVFGPWYCTQKKPPPRWLVAVVRFQQATVQFGLAHIGMGQSTGFFWAGVVRSLLNCNAVGWFRSSYFIYVCTLFVKQSLNMEMALIMARV